MKIGILGGSGLYELDGLKDVEHKELSTPFGSPSDAYVCGTREEREVCFLPRHGKGHRLLPSEINHQANIFGFKMLGVERVFSVSAVGSLKQELRPRDVVLPDQYFDRTKTSGKSTFFGEGIAVHISFAEPTCPELRKLAGSSIRQVIDRQPDNRDIRVTEGGTYINMEGPAFSTKAESHVYRKLGFDVIGMTSLHEAKLCREAEICYQALAMVTDYDCWHKTEEPVTVEMVIGHLMANAELAKEMLKELIAQIPERRTCDCGSALQNAIITSKEYIPDETKKKLSILTSKYL